MPYYWRIIRLAARNSRAFLGRHFFVEVLIIVLSFIVGALYNGTSGDSVRTALIFPAVAVVVILAGVFGWQLVAVPVAVDLDQRGQIAKLTPPPGANLSVETAGRWVYLGVQNTGSTDTFIAQIVQVMGDGEDHIVPWSLKWRQGAEEQRLTSGERRLIEIGEVDHGYTYPKDAPQDIVYYYNLVSSTARFHAGGAITGTFNTDGKGFASQVAEETVRCTLSLRFEVRGVNLGSWVDGWLNLGFDLEQNATAELGPSALAKPVSQSA